MATPTKVSTTERVQQMLARIAELEEEVQRLRAHIQEQAAPAAPPMAEVSSKPGMWINPLAHRVRPSQTEIRAEAARQKVKGTVWDPARRHRPH